MAKKHSAAHPVSEVRQGYPVSALATLAKDLRLQEADVIVELGLPRNVVGKRPVITVMA